MLSDAFNALKTFDWGTDLAVLTPIEDATVAAHADADVRTDLEARLIAALREKISLDARGYVCRKLAIVGTADAVPALADMLGNKASSHMARYALERITAPEAAAALRTALSTVNGQLRIGMITSLGSRRDSAAVTPLGHLLRDSDPAVSRAAALALGAIGNAAAAAVLQAAARDAIGDKQSVIDALLASAEALLADGKRPEAFAIYTSLSAGQQNRLVRLAAVRGLLACSGPQEKSPHGITKYSLGR